METIRIPLANSALSVHNSRRMCAPAGTTAQLQMLMDIEKVSSFVKPSMFIHFHSGLSWPGGREGGKANIGFLVD